jgi:putative transposase
MHAWHGDTFLCEAQSLRSLSKDENSTCRWQRRAKSERVASTNAGCRASKRSIFQVDRNADLFFHVLQSNRPHYKLHAFVIMPDHFHLLLTPGDIALERCLQLIKGGFSRRYHLELSGLRDVWQKGFADHRIRDRVDYDKHLRYIDQNPVAAGLVSHPGEYQWSSTSRVLREKKSLSG